MRDVLRVGLVGANATYGWGKLAHVPAIAAARGVELGGVAARSKHGAEQAARAFGAPLAFENAAALCASPGIDIVVVSVRAPAHRDIVMAAIDHRKAVYCEWPLGATLADTETMAEAAAQAGIPTAIGLQGRQSPWLIHLKNLVDQGAIGRVLSAQLVAYDDLPYEKFSQSNAYMLTRNGGANALAVQGGHFFDAAAFVLGEFETVTGIAATTRQTATIKETGEKVRIEAPDQVAIAAKTKDGVVVGAQIVGGAPFGPSMVFMIQGTGGALRASSGGYMHWRPLELEIARPGSDGFSAVTVPDSLFDRPRAEVGTPDGILACSYDAFADALRQGTRFRPDFADAVIRHRMLAKIDVQPPA